jgi:hypothetical protein
MYVTAVQIADVNVQKLWFIHNYSIYQTEQLKCHRQTQSLIVKSIMACWLHIFDELGIFNRYG